MGIDNDPLPKDLECMPYVLSDLYLLVRNDHTYYVVSSTVGNSQDEECPEYAISFHDCPRECTSDISSSGRMTAKSNDDL